MNLSWRLLCTILLLLLLLPRTLTYALYVTLLLVTLFFFLSSFYSLSAPLPPPLPFFLPDSLWFHNEPVNYRSKIYRSSLFDITDFVHSIDLVRPVIHIKRDEKEMIIRSEFRILRKRGNSNFKSELIRNSKENRDLVLQIE